MSRLLQFGTTAAVLVFASICAAADPLALVPSPNHGGSLTLVGLDPSGKVAAALTYEPDGPAVAYVCDGTKIAVWFTGTQKEDEDKIALTNDQGDTFVADWSGTGNILCQAKIGGTVMKFNLESAPSGRLLREVKSVNGEREVGGWIFTNKGSLFGAKSKGGKVTQGVARRSKKEQIDDGGSSDSTGGVGSSKTPGESTPGSPEARAKVERCKNIVARFDNRAAKLTAEGKDILRDNKLQKLATKFSDLGCTGEGVRITAILDGS